LAYTPANVGPPAETALGGENHGVAFWREDARLVAGISDRCGEAFGVNRVSHIDPRQLGSQVDGGQDDAVDFLQRLLHATYAGGARHPRDLKIDVRVCV
jgi:hypothetical protein